MAEFKYYLNARPAMPGAIPKDFIRLDENDASGRYGAIYYSRELTEKELVSYELKAAKE